MNIKNILIIAILFSCSGPDMLQLRSHQAENQSDTKEANTSMSFRFYLDSVLSNHHYELPDSLNTLFYSIYGPYLEIYSKLPNKVLMVPMDSIFYKRILLKYYISSRIAKYQTDLDNEAYYKYMSIIGYKKLDSIMYLMISEAELEPRIRLISINVNSGKIKDVLLKGYDPMMGDEFYYSIVYFRLNKLLKIEYSIKHVPDSQARMFGQGGFFVNAGRKKFEISIGDFIVKRSIPSDSCLIALKRYNDETIWLER